MTHPNDLLADYIDGTLPAAERTRVDAHIVSCALCATEVADAAQALSALSSLPRVEVPVGVTSSVIREARESRGAGSPTSTMAHSKMRFRMGRVYGLAAASVAALLALVFVLGGHGSQVQVMSGGSRAEMALPAADMNKADNEPGPLDLDGDYSASELSALAAAEAQQRSGVSVSASAGQVAGSSDFAPTAPTVDAGGLSGSSAPVSKQSMRQSRRQTSPVADPGKLDQCLQSIGAYANGGSSADSFEAVYDGIPAYFAVILEGPAPGQPADMVVVWVVSRSNCDVVAFTQQRYPLATPSPLPTTFLEP